jgi:hypothetical protein
MTPATSAATNAANAQLSTGPRTAEGKARSSRNAVKHGLTSKQLVIAPDEEEEFAELHDALHAQVSPEGALEMGIFNMLVHAAWNLERFRTLEARLMADGVDALLDDRTAAALDRLQRYAAAAQRSYFRALRELRTLQSNRIHRRELEGHDDPLPELVVIADVEKRIAQRDADPRIAEVNAMYAYINAPLPKKSQNEPTAPRPASAPQPVRAVASIK